MSKTPGLIVLAISVVFAAENPKETVLAAQRQWLDGYNRRDEKVLSAIEADEFRVAFGDGKIQTKADQLVNIRKSLPAGAKYAIAVEATEVRIYGNAAVLTGIIIEKGGAVIQKSRYTDTWIFQNGRWRVVSSHLSDLK